MILPAAALCRIRELYAQGRYRQALDASAEWGPLREWSNTPARLIAGRMAMQLGAPRLGRQLHLVAFRQSPVHLEATYYHARYRFERFGPFSCWEFMSQHCDWSDAAPELRADWLALQGFVAARMNDLDRAERCLLQADQLAPQRPWISVERAAVLESANKIDEALESARRSLELQAWFRPGVQSVAHLLVRKGKMEEATAFLHEATQQLESGILSAHLASLLMDQGRYADVTEQLDRYEILSPLLDADGQKWLRARRADVAYNLKDPGKTLSFAKQVGEDFYTKFADHLQEQMSRPDFVASDPGQYLLDLRIATPTQTFYEMLGSFWNASLPPLPTDAMNSFDGLPDAVERRRVEKAGWKTREFTLGEDAAHRLIQARIPFLITLVEVGVSQSRLVLGFDPIRKSLSLTDGHDPKPMEAPIDAMLERFRSHGPRCLVMVPENQPALPELPDADLYDRLFAIQCHLADGEYTAAKEQIAGLEKSHPAHRITLLAKLAWARGTGHPTLLLAAANALLKQFPQDSTFSLTKTAALRELGRLPEREQVLAEVGLQFNADPLLMQSLAQIYMTDASRQLESDLLLRRSIRMRPHAAAGYYLLASQRWEQQQFAIAVDLYRFAWCLDDREEPFADAYSRVARTRDLTPDALRFFQRRANRTAIPYPPAVKALFATLLDRDEHDQAFSSLDKSIEKLTEPPCEGADKKARDAALSELLLFRAELRAQFGDFDSADEDLAEARSLSTPVVWLKTALRIARLKPDFAKSKLLLEEILKLEPEWQEGHRQLLGFVLEIEGKPGAHDYANALAKEMPFSYPILRMRAELCSSDTDDAPIQAIQSLLDLCPEDAWAHRQMALVLADRKRDDEAMQQLHLAGQLEPDHPSHYAVLAHVNRRAERVESALDAYRAAIKADVDHELAISELISLSRGRKEKLRACRFIVEQFHQQSHKGDGLMAYRDQILQMASDEEEPEQIEELYADLEKILDNRPDLWQAWSLMIQQLGMMHRLDEARILAIEATERFPLLAQLWIDLARVYAALDEGEDQIEALHRAVSAAPAWPPASHELADALIENEHDEEAIEVLERISARVPMDTTTHAVLAERYWSCDRSEEALDRAKRAVRLDPGFDPAWKMVLQWSDRLDRPDEAIELCRELTQTRPSDVRCWLKLARLLFDPLQSAEALKALDTAIHLDPRSVEAHDLKAERLAEMGKFEEALAAARPAQLATELPLILQGRAAWVEAKRGNYAAAIPPMQALVSVEPEYFWGWQQLAEWYNETGRTAGYLEASSELCRLKPEHPLPLTMRGEAKLKTGDRDGGKNDLRDALRIAPQYAPAAALLFDSYLSDGEYREARAALAVLQEHAGGPEVLVKQIQLCCRMEDCDGAMRTLQELVSTPGDSPPVILQVVLNELEAAGWSEKSAKILRESWKDGKEFHPWSPIYWLDTEEGEAADFSEKLDAVDAVIRLYPKSPSGYDRKAELLCHAGRFDEALAICRVTELGDPPPVTLRGRAAWVEARRGNRRKAIQLMKQAVLDDPAYLWGWRNLAQWYDSESRHKECLEASEQMVRLSPEDPLAFGYRGEARRILGDHKGAKDDFEKAFELDPSFDAAGLHLVAEQLESDELEAAARTLARLEEHSRGPMVRLRSVQLATRTGNLGLARQRLKTLATDAGSTRGIIREAIEAFAKMGWSAEAEEELTTIIDGNNASPAAAAVWAEQLIARDKAWMVLDSLQNLFQRNGPAARDATITYASAMAAAGRPDAAATVIHRYAESLKVETDSWAKAGAALAEAKLFAWAASWLGEWQNREGLEGWMLSPLMDALRAQDRDAEATVVAQKGLELGGSTRVRGEFAGWLALESAINGKTTEAVELLRMIEQIGLPDGIKLIVAMAEGVVMVARAGPEGRTAAFQEAKEHLHVAASACQSGDIPPGAGRWYRRAIDRMRRDTDTMSARLWCLWQRFFPWVRGK